MPGASWNFWVPSIQKYILTIEWCFCLIFNFHVLQNQDWLLRETYPYYKYYPPPLWTRDPLKNPITFLHVFLVLFVVSFRREKVLDPPMAASCLSEIWQAEQSQKKKVQIAGDDATWHIYIYDMLFTFSIYIIYFYINIYKISIMFALYIYDTYLWPTGNLLSLNGRKRVQAFVFAESQFLKHLNCHQTHCYWSLL